jgi:hypothetical protein
MKNLINIVLKQSGKSENQSPGEACAKFSEENGPSETYYSNDNMINKV